MSNLDKTEMLYIIYSFYTIDLFDFMSDDETVRIENESMRKYIIDIILPEVKKNIDEFRSIVVSLTNDLELTRSNVTVSDLESAVEDLNNEINIRDRIEQKLERIQEYTNRYIMTHNMPDDEPL